MSCEHAPAHRADGLKPPKEPSASALGCPVVNHPPLTWSATDRYTEVVDGALGVSLNMVLFSDLQPI